MTVRDMIKFAEGKIIIKYYLPNYDYPNELNIEWLWNLISSLIHEEFKEYANEKVEKGRKSYINNKNYKITTNKEIINIFKALKSVSIKNEK